MIDLEKLIQNGVQFGHQTWRWSPRMQRYIWGKKNGVHLIDVSKTAAQLEKAAQFLEEVVAEGRQILWVGTKKAAQDIINETADRLKNPRASHRWVGGTLTNYPQVKKSVTKLLHFEDIVEKADKAMYTKKELGSYQKVVARLQKSVGGVRNLTWPIGAVVVIDAKKEATAIKEANVMGVPVVALVDTNSDPSGVAIVIPGNDDVARSIRVIVDELAAAVERGLEKAREHKAAAPTEEQLAAEQSAVEQVFGQSVEEEEEEGRTGRRAPRARRTDRSSGEGLVVPDQKSNGPRFGNRSRQGWQRPDGQPIEGQAPETPRADGERRPYGPRPEGERRPYSPRPEGERRPYGPRADGERRPYSPRPYGPRPEGQTEGGEGQRPEGERRPWTPRPEGERRPWTPRPDGERRPYSPRPYGPRPEGPRPEGQTEGGEGQRPEGERRPWTPRPDRPYSPRPYGPRPDGERRPYGPRPDGERRPYGPRPDGERRPYSPRPYGPRPEGQTEGGEGQRPDGERRPYGPRPDGERRPYGPRPDGERRPYGPRPDGERRPYGPRPDGERRPYGPRPDGERRPYSPRPEGPRPEGQRPEGPRPEGPRPEGQQPEQKPDTTVERPTPQNDGNDNSGSSTPS